MKRFITYLYEYHLGEKKRNVGFVRVDIRNSMVNMEVCIRNYMQTNEKGNVYGLIQKDRLYSVMLGEIMSHGRQSDNRICFEKDNIGNSGCSIEEIAGIVICFENNGYLASCWRDDSAEEIAREIFSPYKADVMIAERECLQEENVTPVKEKEDSVVEGIQKVEEKHLEQKNSEEKEDYITYQKIELNQIRELPSQNWHLCNNSFLMHGAFNYGYLLLKKVIEDEKEIWMLGVPGFFEKAEMVMAVFFGFPEFEAVPKTVVDMEMNIESMPYDIKEGQEPKTGIFGAWFVKLEE